MRLEFTHFDIQGHPGACYYDDYVKISDGDGKILIDKICGFSGINPDDDFNLYFLPPVITTRSNRVEIFFHTNGRKLTVPIQDHTSDGWRLSWSAEIPGLKALICPQLVCSDT